MWTELVRGLRGGPLPWETPVYYATLYYANIQLSKQKLNTEASTFRFSASSGLECQTLGLARV